MLGCCDVGCLVYGLVLLRVYLGLFDCLWLDLSGCCCAEV